MSRRATANDVGRMTGLVEGGSPARPGDPGTPPVELRPLWSAADVSTFLGVPVATLHQWRYLGRGPAAYRVGKHLRYDPEIVRRWLVDECAGEPA
jgi:hypothetical protein